MDVNTCVGIFLCLLYNVRSQHTFFDVRIASLIPFDSADGGCTKNAIEMGIEDVNSQLVIAHKTNANKSKTFRLSAQFEKTGPKEGSVIEAQYQLYRDNYVKLSTIGPPYKDQNEYCTEYTTAQANFHVSYSEANEPVENYYVMYLQTPPSIVSSFFAARAFMRAHNWKRVAIIYDYSDKRYRKNADNLREKMEMRDSQNKTIKVLTDQGIWSKPAAYGVSTELGTIQTLGARIILSLVSVSGARKVFCEAYHRNMYKPKVIWVLFETLPNGWASDKYNVDYTGDGVKREIDCTESELLTAASGYISITKQGLRRDKKRTVSKMTSDEFIKRLQKRVNVTCDENVAYAYDAVWLLGLTYQEKAVTQDLSTYTYYIFWYAIGLADTSRKLTFEGITGPISYKTQLRSIYSRIGQTSLWVNKNDKVSTFLGMHDTNSDNLMLVRNSKNILFDGGIVPKDEATYVTAWSNFAKPLFITMWLVSVVGILLALFFLIVTLIFMHDKNISMSSPAINCTIIFGSILCYLSVVIYGVDTRFVSKEDTPYVCYAFLFTLSIGFTLTFGSLFAKAWQLYKLYMTPEVKVANHQIQMKSVPEWFLFIIISAFVLVDILIFGLWIGISPFKYEVQNITTTENLFHDVIEIEQIAGCLCKYETEFTIGIYCYKGIMLIFGIFLAWQTRNAKIKIQNESKQIAMAIYNVVAVSLIGVICVSVLANTTRHQATYAIVAVCTCICNTTTLLLVFLPKIRKIINSDGITINSDKSEGSSAKESPNGKYSLAFKRKKMDSKDSCDIKSIHSTETFSTQISTKQQHQQQQQHEEEEEQKQRAMTQGSSLPSSTGSSIASINPSYLSSASFMIPPEYEPKDESKRVDSMGRLSSGIYVGTIDEETDVAVKPDEQGDFQEEEEEEEDKVENTENIA